MSIWKTKVDLKQGAKDILAETFRILVKIFVVLSLCFYVIMGVGSLSNIAREELNKIREVSYLSIVIEDAMFGNQLEDIDEWIKQRPNLEIEQIVEIIKPHSSNVQPTLFFIVAFKLLEEDKEEEALFWYLLGKYRFRYDMLRCGAGDAIDKLDNLVNAINVTKVNYLLNLIDKDIKRTKNIIKRVLEFDNKYPAKNPMEYACQVVKLLEKGAVPLSEGSWDHMRYSLRSSAEKFINSK